MPASSKPTTSKKKLDALLGIEDGSSVDEFLENLTIENDSAETALSSIDEGVKAEVAKVDEQLATIKDKDFRDKMMSLIDIKDSLNSINELIEISKGVIKHVYDNIICTELVDSDLIHAAAAFIESCRLNVHEYIDIYKDRVKFLEKVEFEMLQQGNRMQLLEKKYELEMKKKEAQGVDAVPENMRTFNTDEVMNALKNIDL